LMHKGEDCWKDCGKSGPCSWCGTGKCCRQGYNGGENGCAVDEGGQDKHVCISASQQTRNEALATAPPSAASATLPPSISFSGGQTFLMHKGEDCWKDCGKSGPCSWCGTGKCCRQGYNGGENGCAVDEGGQDKHVCISASQHASTKAPGTPPPSAAPATVPPQPPPKAKVSFGETAGAVLFADEVDFHLGIDCWSDCGKSGPCKWCGDGKCCRQGYNGGENGCGAAEGGQNKHVCVSASSFVIDCEASANKLTCI